MDQDNQMRPGQDKNPASGREPAPGEASLPDAQQPAGPPGEKREKPKWLIPTIAGACIVLICICLFSFGTSPGMSRRLSPEKYLRGALDSALSDLRDGFDAYPDVAAYMGSPFALEYSVSGDFYLGWPLRGVSEANGVLKADPGQGKSLMEFSISQGEYALKDNKLYIAPDQIALSLPGLYDKASFITLNPSDLELEWDESIIGKYTPYPSSLPKRWNSAQVGQACRDGVERFTRESRRVLGELYAQGDFTDEGEQTVMVDEREITLNAMTHTWQPDAVNSAYVELTGLYRQLLLELFTPFASTLPKDNLDQLLDEYISAFDYLRAATPVTLRYYVDSAGQLRRLELERFEVDAATPFTPRPYIHKVSGSVDLSGEDAPTDRIDARLALAKHGFDELAHYTKSRHGGEDAAIVYSLFRSRSTQAGAVGDVITLETGYNWEMERATLEFISEWYQGQTGDNFRVRVESGDAYETASYELTGRLTQAADELTLENGRYEQYAGDREMRVVKMMLRLCGIDSAELDVDTGSSVSFRRLDPADLLDPSNGD